MWMRIEAGHTYCSTFTPGEDIRLFAWHGGEDRMTKDEEDGDSMLGEDRTALE